MNKFDISKVDVKLMMIFKAVFEEGSVTGASNRMHLSQSVVSHALDRLRLAFNDPLFVKSGRGITPTDRAKHIAPLIAEIIEQLINLSEPGNLNTHQLTTEFCLSANDFERRLITPHLISNLIDQAPAASLRLINTTESIADLLRSRKCDVVISPIPPPDFLDFYSEPLFSDTFTCFFDANKLSITEVQESYETLNHAIAQFTDSNSSKIETLLASLGKKRCIKLTAPNFESLPELITGTRLVATLPSMLSQSIFASFGSTPFPFPSPELNFHLIWHKSTHHSPQYKWFRSLIKNFFA